MSHVPCGDLMTRRRRLPAASAWVLWSSPLLLIVLVLTLGSTNRAGDPSATPPGSGRSSAPSVVTTASTFPPAHPHRVPGRRATPVPTDAATTTTTTTTTSAATSTEPDRTGPAPSTAASSSSTASSATASVGASATSEPVAGQLGAGLSSVVVPVAGPRTWTLASSAPLSATLTCDGQATTVAGSFAVGSTSCELALADPTGQAVTWQLTPAG